MARQLVSSGSDMRAASGSSIGGLLVALACSACQDHDPTPPLADTTSTGGDGQTGDETTGTPASPGLPPRPEARTCRFDGWAPGLLPPLSFEPIDVPAVTGARALVAGRDGVMIVGTDDGRLVALSPGDASEPLRELLPADGSRITGLAFDASTGLDALYVRSEIDAPIRTRVIRHTLTDPRTLDATAALEVITFDHTDVDARRGAGLFAGEGLLFIPLGDDAIGNDAGPTDDPHMRPGNLLRLDVSTLAAPYDWSLPPDNPLASEGGTAAEAWAWGLRDPAVCTYDPARERLWCADTGAAVSEVSLVPSGANLGWPRLEGGDCRVPGGCEGLDTTLPLASYRHVDDDCGVGPAAYADGMDAELDGALVYADRCSGKLFAAHPAEGTRKTARTVVGRLDPVLAAMASDPQGGLVAVDVEGRLGRLVTARPPGQFPTALSESGCFAGPGVGTPAPDLVPYVLNAPLWTDGSHKQRHIVLPPGMRIGIEADGGLSFPESTAILKTFSYALDPFEPDALTPVETRVMIRRDWGWEFHSYAWDEGGVDAQLLGDGQVVPLLTSQAGAPTIVRHTFPSRDECGYCHGTGETHALGARLDQLARTVDYDGLAMPQVDALAEIDMFDGPLPDITPITDYTDEDAADEPRARAYLHANCGHCHRPGGWTPPDLDMDLRWTTPLAETRLCGVRPQYSSTFSAEYRVAAGDPSDSLVWLRLSSRGPWQMPPVATSIPDPHAAVVRAWIEALSECPVD